jgi:CubicO group peptidase (beta-lactamase class C family)
LCHAVSAISENRPTPRLTCDKALAALILVQNKARPNEPQTEAPSPPTAPLKTHIEQAKLIARLEALLPQLMKEGEVPGLAIALIRDGEVVWHHGFGVKDSKTKDPVDDATVFEAASLSKPVFACAVLNLVDAGKFDLDKPLNKYMPGNFDVDDVRLSQITARHVLTRTTGFSNGYNGKNRKMFFAPGERFSYLGDGFEYLWMVIEYVTGEQLKSIVPRRSRYKMSPGGLAGDCRLRKTASHFGIGGTPVTPRRSSWPLTDPSWLSCSSLTVLTACPSHARS